MMWSNEYDVSDDLMDPCEVVWSIEYDVSDDLMDPCEVV